MTALGGLGDWATGPPVRNQPRLIDRTRVSGSKHAGGRTSLCPTRVGPADLTPAGDGYSVEDPPAGSTAAITPPACVAGPQRDPVELFPLLPGLRVRIYWVMLSRYLDPARKVR